MKKLLAGVLALALAASMAVPAFAETTTGGNSSIQVTGEYRDGAASPETIAADITWEDMTFNYTEGEKTWNPETHQVDQADGTWSGGAKAITVTNHSNVGIMAKFAFAPNGDIVGSFTKDSTPTDQLTLATAGSTEVAAAPTGTVNFAITGGTITQSGKLGTITVYIVPNDGSNYISTETELIEAAKKGGSFKLANDLDINDRIISAESDFEVDLNGKSINGSCGFIGQFVTQKISNGTIHTSNSGESALWSTGEGNAIVVNCTLTANDYYAVYLTVESTATITDSTLTGSSSFGAAIASGKNTVLTFVGSNVINGDVVVQDGGKVIFSENITLNGSIDKRDENSTVVCEAGTYSFDPTPYVNGEAYDITTDGSTWTVTAK